jgi:hypothetical protein
MYSGLSTKQEDASRLALTITNKSNCISGRIILLKLVGRGFKNLKYISSEKYDDIDLFKVPQAIYF